MSKIFRRRFRFSATDRRFCITLEYSDNSGIQVCAPCSRSMRLFIIRTSTAEYLTKVEIFGDQITYELTDDPAEASALSCRKAKSSPGDFRHPLRGRFFINCFALPAALGSPSPASLIFRRKSKYPPAQWIYWLRNKYRSCVRNSLARSRFFPLRSQKNRWIYQTSTGFSLLPAAGQPIS